MRKTRYEDGELEYKLTDREEKPVKCNEVTDALVRQIASMTNARECLLPIAEIDGDCHAPFILQFRKLYGA